MNSVMPLPFISVREKLAISKITPLLKKKIGALESGPNKAHQSEECLHFSRTKVNA